MFVKLKLHFCLLFLDLIKVTQKLTRTLTYMIFHSWRSDLEVRLVLGVKLRTDIGLTTWLTLIFTLTNGEIFFFNSSVGGCGCTFVSSRNEFVCGLTMSCAVNFLCFGEYCTDALGFRLLGFTLFIGGTWMSGAFSGVEVPGSVSLGVD